jgi:hypothetical protein
MWLSERIMAEAVSASSTCTDSKCLGYGQAMGVGRCDACVAYRERPPELSAKRHRVVSATAQQLFDRAIAQRQAKQAKIDAAAAKNFAAAPKPANVVVARSPSPVVRSAKKFDAATHSLRKAVASNLSKGQQIRRLPPSASVQPPGTKGFAAPSSSLAAPRLAVPTAQVQVVPSQDQPEGPVNLNDQWQADQYALRDHEYNADMYLDFDAARLPLPSGSSVVLQTAAPSAAGKAGNAPAGKAPARDKSKRKHAVTGLPLTHSELAEQAKRINEGLPKQLRLKNIQQKKIYELDAWLQEKDDTVATASIAAINGALHRRLTPEVNRLVCMRMLMLLATNDELLELYLEACGGTTRVQMDGHKIAGQGPGLNHRFWVEMVAQFNDTAIVSDFPFEYVCDEKEEIFSSADPTLRVRTPAKYDNGFFLVFGIRQPNFPEHFTDSFFDTAVLAKIFTQGVTEYQNADTNFHSSGQHGLPFWHFVSPIKTVLAEDQHLYMDLASKRWDSLAFLCMFRQVRACVCVRACAA